MRPRLEAAALAGSGAAVIAFVVSFALGLRGERAQPVEPVKTADHEEITVPLNRGNGKRVEVLNASRRSGLARQATVRLREAGYDVVYFGSAAGADEGRSLVIDRIGDPEVARGAARELGIDSVLTRIDSTRLVEASVVLSTDWQAAQESAARQESWWKRLLSRLRPAA